MTYVKQTWTDGAAGGTPISATRLNYMETGIEAANAIPLVLQSPVASTADLIQGQTSAGAVLLRLTKDGDFRWPTTEPTLATPFTLGNFEVPWTNGPGGEPNYTDHVMFFGYNVGAGGTVIDSTQSQVYLQFEHRFYQTFPSGASGFGSEVHFNFRSPTGATTRPWGASYNHATGEISTGIRGGVAWEKSDGSAVQMQLHENNKLLNLNGGVSMSVTSEINAMGNVDIGGRSGTYPSILAVAGSTQTTAIIDIRNSSNVSLLRVMPDGTATIPGGGGGGGGGDHPDADHETLAVNSLVLHTTGAESKSGIFTLTDHTIFKSIPWADPKAWRAVGDGTPANTRTLSSLGFTTVSAAQAEWPTLGGVSGMGGSAWIPIIATSNLADWAGIQSAIDAQTGSTNPLRDYPGDSVGPGDSGYAAGIRFARAPVRLLGLTGARVDRPIVVRSVSGMSLEGPGPDGFKITPRSTTMNTVIDLDGVEAFALRNVWVEGATVAEAIHVDSGIHLHWSQAGHVDPALPFLRPARSTSNTTMDHVKVAGDLGVGIGVAMDVTGDALGQVDFGDYIKVVAKGSPPGPHDPDISLPSTTTTSGSTSITGASILASHRGRRITGTGIPGYTILTTAAAGSATMSRAATASGTITATLLKKFRAGVQVGDGTYGNPKAHQFWQPSIVRFAEGISAQAVQVNVYGGQFGSNGYDFALRPPASPNIIQGVRCEESDGLLYISGGTAFQTISMSQMQLTAPNYTNSNHYQIDFIGSHSLFLEGLDLNRFLTTGTTYTHVGDDDLIDGNEGTVNASPAAGLPPFPQIRFRTPSAVNPAGLVAANVATPRKFREAYVFNTGTVAVLLNQVQINAGKQPIRIEPLGIYTDGTLRFHVDHRGNVNVGDMAETLGGGIGVIGVRNAVTPPATTPTNGSVLYSEGGKLKTKGTDGVALPVTARYRHRTSGLWHPPDVAAVASLALTINFVYAVPVESDYDQECSSIGINIPSVAGATGNVLRLGIYLPTTTNMLGTVHYDAGTVLADSTGFKEIIAPFILPAGLSWLVVVGQGSGTMPTVQGMSGPMKSHVGTSTPTTYFGAVRAGLVANPGLSGALTANPTGVVPNGTVGMVLVKAT